MPAGGEHGRRLTRRRFIGEASAAALAAGTLAAPAYAQGRPPAGRSVAVLGGGMAGLAAAHELAERGFSVTVYERKALGGKARSIPVRGTGTDGRADLPGEHGFRFFPGFYHHVPDTMRRIPVPGNRNGVWDNLVDAQGVSFARSGGREDLALAPGPELLTPEALIRLLVAGFEQITTLPPDDLLFFATRLLVYFTSSEERRLREWDHVSWWEFVDAERRSAEYQRMLAIGLTRNLVAAKAEIASTRTIGKMAEAFIYTMLGRGNDGAPDRLLDAPTNEAWIDPWVAHLTALGVRFEVGRTVERLELEGGRIAGALVRARDGSTEPVEADWYVLAVPVERAVPLLRDELLEADPGLAGMRELHTAWMNGIQFYLRREVPIIRGHLSYVDSPWALTSISQAQFWAERDFARDYGDGSVRDCLSVDISDWETPGILYGKPAAECSAEEIAAEVWAQIKAHLEDTGRRFLPGEVLHSWFLDPAITFPAGEGRARNDEPLLVNTVGAWERRPRAATAIENLFLAGDYVQVDVDLATMEGANESARAAVNALLERSGSNEARVPTYRLYRPPEFELLKQIDAQRLRAGQPNLLDIGELLAL